MAHNYEEFPFPEFKHAIKNGKNTYRNKFFHDIDLSFLLRWMENIEGENYTIRIIGDKLQLIDGEGQVVSEVTLSEGQQGPPGITPNVSAAAFVNDGTGTPSVEVVKSGTTENPTFSFNFSNLKGATGATGPASTVPGPAGTPFQVKAKYDTYAEMIAAHPTGEVGDAYQVGETIDYYTKSEVDERIPDSSQATNGSVLTKTATGNGWYPPVKELPTIASGDAGKVLAVNAGETGVEWTTPSGGGGDDYIYSNVYIRRMDDWSNFVSNFASISISISIILQNHVDYGYTKSWDDDWNTQINVNQTYTTKAAIAAAVGQNLTTWSAPVPTDPNADEARWALRAATIVFVYDNDTYVGDSDTTNLLKDKTIIPIVDNMIPDKIPRIITSNGDFIPGLPWTAYKQSSQNRIVLEIGYWHFVLPDEGGIFVPGQYDNIPVICN